MKRFLLVIILSLGLNSIAQIKVKFHCVDAETKQNINGVKAFVNKSHMGDSGPSGKNYFNASSFDDSISFYHPNYKFESRKLMDYVGTINGFGEIAYEVNGIRNNKLVNYSFSVAQSSKIVKDSIEISLYDFDFNNPKSFVYNPFHLQKAHVFKANTLKGKYTLKLPLNELKSDYIFFNSGKDSIWFDRNFPHKNLFVNQIILHQKQDEISLNNLEKYIELIQQSEEEKQELIKKYEKKIEALEDMIVDCTGIPFPEEEIPVKDEIFKFYSREERDFHPKQGWEKFRQEIASIIESSKIKKQGILYYEIDILQSGEAKINNAKKAFEHREVSYKIENLLDNVIWKHNYLGMYLPIKLNIQIELKRRK